MRNELMQRAPMRAPQQQMAAAPMEEQASNPLMQRRGPAQPQQDMDPTSIFLGKAKALGIDIEQALQGGGDQKQVLQEAMKAIWQAEPTDENGEMIDTLSQHLGIPPPWQKGDGMMKLGGPQEEGRGMPSTADYEEMAPQQRGFANSELARQHNYMTEARESEDPGSERAFGRMQPPLSRYRDLRAKQR